ncbi:hypothetical protein K0M31_017165, partial [Melipona bicolor]
AFRFDRWEKKKKDKEGRSEERSRAVEFVGKPGLSYDGVPADLPLGPFFSRAGILYTGWKFTSVPRVYRHRFPPPVIVSRRKRKAGVENNGEDTTRRRVRSCAKRESQGLVVERWSKQLGDRLYRLAFMV